MNFAKLLEEAADMLTEQSAEHAQACRHAAVALTTRKILPNCMMPDGGEACAGYRQLERAMATPHSYTANDQRRLK